MLAPTVGRRLHGLTRLAARPLGCARRDHPTPCAWGGWEKEERVQPGWGKSGGEGGGRGAAGPGAAGPRVRPGLTALCSPGNLYSRLVHLDGDHVAVQIQDTPGCIQVQEDCVQVLDSLSRCVKWAEGFLLVYSITDYSSYQSVQPLYQHIRKVHPDTRTPIIIVGNKADLLHARQVQAKEGLQLADELGSLFLEISTSEDSQGVCDVFQYLCKEVSKLQHAGSTDRRRSSIIPRPKSPNMQDLKRRFKQALSSKVK
ncbi:ras-like protein family member 11A [Geospiza fortis]|uniref:small monomeric GTPase n=1 Tax=Geospiza fortis TaxID=48883 RepID=A0A8N5F450_GEOFO|nr:ras-like protein family member 11A [Geospiza fortis]